MIGEGSFTTRIGTFRHGNLLATTEFVTKSPQNDKIVDFRRFPLKITFSHDEIVAKSYKPLTLTFNVKNLVKIIYFFF